MKWQKRLVVVFLSLSITAVVTLGMLNQNGERGSEVALAHSSDRFPGNDLSDWVTWSEKVVGFTVTGETREDIASQVVESGEGYVGRTVTIEIDDVLWQRESERLQEPKSLEISAWGWRMHDSKLVPMVAVEGIRLEVGKRYIGALAYAKGHQSQMNEWGLLSSSAVLEIENGVSKRPETPNGETTVAVDQVSGQSIEEIAILLSQSSIDESVADYMELDPDSRMEIWLAANG